ncbi:MAG TPA: hypothetical protein VNA87_03335, partial [Actinomycetota bacterium]|nr:hypothetical protein [Actinomycetota bacterium]
TVANTIRMGAATLQFRSDLIKGFKWKRAAAAMATTEIRGYANCQDPFDAKAILATPTMLIAITPKGIAAAVARLWSLPFVSRCARAAPGQNRTANKKTAPAR